MGRLRCSAGIEVERYTGSLYRRNAIDVEFPALSADSAFGAVLRIDSSLPTSRPALLQFALLYSTATGERRIRREHRACPSYSALVSDASVTHQHSSKVSPCADAVGLSVGCGCQGVTSPAAVSSGRVHTLALPVRDALGQVFRGVDLEAQLSMLATDLAAKVLVASP